MRPRPQVPSRPPADAWTIRLKLHAKQFVAGAILERLGVRSEPVATLLSTGTSLSECFLGILHAGKAYLPLDPSNPPGRIAELISDSGARLLLTDGRHEALAKEVVKGPVDILGVGDIEPSTDLSPSLPSIPPDTPCWIIYISGTGTARGSLRGLQAGQRVWCKHIVTPCNTRLRMPVISTFLPRIG